MHNIASLFLGRKAEQTSTGFLVFSRSFVASLLWYQRHTRVHRVCLLRVWTTEFAHLFSHHLCEFTHSLFYLCFSSAFEAGDIYHSALTCNYVFFFGANFFQTQKLRGDNLCSYT